MPASRSRSRRREVKTRERSGRPGRFSATFFQITTRPVARALFSWSVGRYARSTSPCRTAARNELRRYVEPLLVVECEADRREGPGRLERRQAHRVISSPGAAQPPRVDRAVRAKPDRGTTQANWGQAAGSRYPSRRRRALSRRGRDGVDETRLRSGERDVNVTPDERGERRRAGNVDALEGDAEAFLGEVSRVGSEVERRHGRPRVFRLRRCADAWPARPDAGRSPRGAGPRTRRGRQPEGPFSASPLPGAFAEREENRVDPDPDEEDRGLADPGSLARLGGVPPVEDVLPVSVRSKACPERNAHERVEDGRRGSSRIRLVTSWYAFEKYRPRSETIHPREAVYA